MLKLYFAPRTRSVRIAWLLEELALPYELAHVTFRPPARTFFNQDTPTDAASHPDLIEDAVSRARQRLVHLEHELGAGPYLLGERFSAADVMMGFTLVAAAQLKVLDASLPVLSAYVERLLARPALARVLAMS